MLRNRICPAEVWMGKQAQFLLRLDGSRRIYVLKRRRRIEIWRKE